MKYIRNHFGAKLLLSYVSVIIIGLVVLMIAISFTAPIAYNRHMMGMGSQNPGGMMGPGGMQPGRGPGYADFRAGLIEALFYAALVSVIVAVIVSIVFSRGVVSPLRAMMKASHHIAEGHFDERVVVSGSDELAQLADRFNSMGSQLEQVETRRRQLIGDVSHELRTPLTTIRGSMEGLLDGKIPASPVTYELILHETERLSLLVNDLQELSRVESGAYQLDIGPIQVSALVNPIVHRFDQQLKQKDISLTVDLPVDLPNALADEYRIEQVLSNLVANAIQYTPPGGQIIIACEHHNDELLFSIKDTGIGIPPEQLENVFERFYRVDKSRSRSQLTGGGSGIGLTIARFLVEAHKGRIWVESPGEGKGSVFMFTLPVEK